MGDTRRETLLERWDETEPLRLRVWPAAAAVIALAVPFGLWTGDQAAAVAAVVSVVLLGGAAEAGRRVAWAPRTVERVLDQQHTTSYADGVDAGREELATELAASHVQRTPDQVAAELAASQVQRTPDQVAAELVPSPGRHRAVTADTTAIAAVAGPGTTERAALPRCAFAEDGRRCKLPEHPDTFPHALEDMTGQE